MGLRPELGYGLGNPCDVSQTPWSKRLCRQTFILFRSQSQSPSECRDGFFRWSQLTFPLELLLYSILILSWDRVSCSIGWPSPPYVAWYSWLPCLSCDYRHMPPYLAYVVLGSKSMTSLILGKHSNNWVTFPIRIISILDLRWFFLFPQTLVSSSV